ncbi:Uncharacterised protein [uncultured archaeon]|nr:Uncharacterised protein [uncultured archaeon]
MARILVRGSKYAREELRQEEKPFIIRMRGKPILCLIDNDTREAKRAFEFVAGPVKLISPWAEVYEVNPIEPQMHDAVRLVLKRFCFGGVAKDIIAEIARREEEARREEAAKNASPSPCARVPSQSKPRLPSA